MQENQQTHEQQEQDKPLSENEENQEHINFLDEQNRENQEQIETNEEEQDSQNDLPSEDDLETYRIVFELFDRDRSGFIDAHDLAAIAVKLQKDPSEGKLFD